MKLKELNAMAKTWTVAGKMPALFLGHGSPMNAIQDNEFVSGFRTIAATIPPPSAILCISAHWETRGTYVTAMQRPPTIHDFGGFPKALFEVQYPAPGKPELAKEAKSLVQNTDLVLDDKWGLDHGTWSVIRHMYPNADIPIVQLSLDYYQDPQYHYDLARELKSLRNKGVLIIGSGNMVHNLRMVEWQHLDETFGFDWALEANERMKQFISADDHQSLIHYNKQGKPFHLAVPTPEHYMPLLYTLGVKEKNEGVIFFNDKPVGGSLTMTSVVIG